MLYRLVFRLEGHPIKQPLFSQSGDTCFLIQNQFKGWKAKINRQYTPLLEDPYFPKILLPSGRHSVKFIFERKEIFYLHLVQMITLIRLTILYVIFRLREMKNKNQV